MKKLVSLVSLEKGVKMSFVSVSFNEEIGESGESRKRSKNTFLFCELQRVKQCGVEIWCI